MPEAKVESSSEESEDVLPEAKATINAKPKGHAAKKSQTKKVYKKR